MVYIYSTTQKTIIPIVLGRFNFRSTLSLKCMLQTLALKPHICPIKTLMGNF